MAKRSISARAREALAFARQQVNEGKDWVAVQNALFGLTGKCTMLFPTREERTAFLKTEEQRQIGKLLDGLYVLPADQAGASLDYLPEDLHIRLPHALAEALRTRAKAEGVALNHLILAKLSEVVRPAAAESARQRKKRA
jgi:hypothetical protein